MGSTAKAINHCPPARTHRRRQGSRTHTTRNARKLAKLLFFGIFLSPSLSLSTQTPEDSVGSSLCFPDENGGWNSWEGECLAANLDSPDGFCVQQGWWGECKDVSTSCSLQDYSVAARLNRVYPCARDSRDAVREAFLHAWSGYKKYAWGRDELAPVSRHYKTTFGDLGVTIVDALDTAILMGLWDEYE